jgi:hypothetical protein
MEKVVKKQWDQRKGKILEHCRLVSNNYSGGSREALESEAQNEEDTGNGTQ